MSSEKMAFRASKRLLVAVLCVAAISAEQAFDCVGASCEPRTCSDGFKCFNGGFCNTQPDAIKEGALVKCICPPGYRQAGCTTKVVECPGGKWCINGGTCGKTMCDCPVGFKGGHCHIEEEMDKCGNGHFCQNGGECNANLDDHAYPCICPQGFKGSRCQVSVVNCPGGKWCENGGTCGKTMCDCPVGFEGGHCHIVSEANPVADTSTQPPARGDDNVQMILTISIPCGGAILGMGIFMIYMVKQERQGKPIFQPLDQIKEKDSQMTTMSSTSSGRYNNNEQ